jgi:hypothetical protein
LRLEASETGIRNAESAFAKDIADKCRMWKRKELSVEEMLFGCGKKSSAYDVRS